MPRVGSSAGQFESRVLLGLSVDLKCTPAQSLALIWRQRAHRIQRPSGRSSSALGAEAVAVCSRDVSLLVWRFRAASLSGVWACVVPHHNALCVRCFGGCVFQNGCVCQVVGGALPKRRTLCTRCARSSYERACSHGSRLEWKPGRESFHSRQVRSLEPPVPQVSKRQFDSTANEIRIAF